MPGLSGCAPRRNPDIVVAVLWEHGGWGSGSAQVAAQVIEAFVNKQRRLNHNLATEKQAPVEVGAVWSDPAESRMRMGGKTGGSACDEGYRQEESASWMQCDRRALSSCQMSTGRQAGVTRWRRWFASHAAFSFLSRF